MEHCQWVFHLPLNACTRHGQSSFTHLTSYIRLPHLTTLNSFLRDIDHSLTASLTASMVGYLDPSTTSFSLFSHSGYRASCTIGLPKPCSLHSAGTCSPSSSDESHLAASVLPPHLHSAFVSRLWKFSLPHLPILVVLFRLHALLHFVVPLPLPQLVPPFVHLGYLHLAQQRLQLVASRNSVRAWQEATHAQMPLPCTSSSQRCLVCASTHFRHLHLPI